MKLVPVIPMALLAVIAKLATTHATAQSVPATALLPESCLDRTDVLGISRIVEIDAKGSPRFGNQYPGLDFLQDHEVVLTFDDGPLHRYTMPILNALDAECTRATFFIVGRMAISDPATLKETARRGHTIASHTWSHKKLRTLSAEKAKEEIELGLSATSKALGGPVAPFFRFPYLGDTKATLAYLEGRDLGVFGINVDARDFGTKNPANVVRTVMSQLQAAKKGIILFHDIQPSTAGAIATLLDELKKKGFKVVHMVAKGEATTLPQYDAMAEKLLAAKQVAAKANPMLKRSVVWPVGSPKRDSGLPDKGDGDEILPWQTTSEPAQGTALAPAAGAGASAGGQPPAPSEKKRERKPAPAVPADESWQVNPLGN